MAPLPPIRKRSRRAFLVALAGGGLGLTAAAYARFHEPDFFEVAEVEIDQRRFGAPRGLRILQLSDLHLGPHVSLEMIDRAITLGLAGRPDLIALTGDFVTGRLKLAAEYAAVLRRLSAAVPTFACLGNHDAIVADGRIGEVARVAAITQLLRSANIELLLNSSREISVRGKQLRISGLGDLWTKQNRPALCLQPALPRELAGPPHLLLNHNPDARAGLMGYHWDLMLCGHTHGGQVGLPWVAERLAPVKDKSHIEGLREREGRLIYITRGVGNLHGLRFWCRPQVSLLTVR